MHYALEITRVYEFEEIRDRNEFVGERPLSRIRVCPDCARKALGKRTRNQFLNECHAACMKGLKAENSGE